MLSACLAKSTRASRSRRQSSSRLLNDALPLKFCNRLITAKPPLSHTTTISLWPVSTDE